MKPVYCYRDLKKYLRDYYEFHKKNTPGFSFESFSKLAGIKSPNYLKLVMDGKRSLSIKTMHQFARAMRLDFSELNSFEALVNFSQSEKPDEKEYYRLKLEQLTNSKPKESQKLETEVYFKDWYHAASLIALHDQKIKNGTKRLQKVFSLKKDQAEELIEELVEKRLIFANEDYFKMNSEHILFKDLRSNRQSYRRFQRDQLALSKYVLDKHYDQDAKFLAHTFSVAAEHFDLVKGRLDEFLASLTKETNEDRPDRIMQLNIQLFDLKLATKKQNLN